MPTIAVPRARRRYGMMVETTAGRMTNAAWAQAVASASTGTVVQMLGIEMATTSTTPKRATSSPTKAMAAGGLLRNRASARRPEMAMAMSVGMAMSVPTTPRWKASSPRS